MTICGQKPEDWFLAAKSPQALQIHDLWKAWNQANLSSFDFKTSGTTGPPKTLSFSREQIECSVNRTHRWLGMAPGDRWLLALPLDYVAGRMVVFRCLIGGMDLWPVPPALVPWQEPISANAVSLTPSMMAAMLHSKAGAGAFQHIDRILLGGAPLLKDLELALQALGKTRVWHTYGMTETLTQVAARPLFPHSSPWFQAIDPSIQLSVEEDCLTIHDPSLGLNQLRTKDRVEFDARGRFLWKGRADDVINSGGLKHYPSDWEEKLKHPWLEGKTWLIRPAPDPQFGQVAALWVESKEAPPAHLLEDLNLKLTGAMKIKQLHTRPVFEKTLSGKIRLA